MLKTVKYLTIGTAIILLLNACTSIPIKQNLPKSNHPQLQWLEYQENLSKLNAWKATGIIGIVIDNNGQSANFIWKQNQQDFWLQVYGPLGLGVVTFEGNNAGATMKQSNGTLKKAKTLELLMQQELGWYLPLDNLFYWARGLYNPNLPYKTELNEYGLPHRIEQQGWHINYQGYALFSGHYPLAQKMVLHYHNIKLTAVIKTWTINP